LQDARERALDASKLTLPTKLEQLRKVVKEEHGSVRAMALDRLLVVIRTERRQFDELLLQNPDIAHYSIIHLMKVRLKDNWMGFASLRPVTHFSSQTLLESSRDADKHVQVKVGKLLGEIGAIDPTKLDIRSKVGHAILSDIGSANETSFELKLRKEKAIVKVRIL